MDPRHSISVASTAPRTHLGEEARKTLARVKRQRGAALPLFDHLGRASSRVEVEAWLAELERARTWFRRSGDDAAVSWLTLAICRDNLRLGRFGGLHELCELDVTETPRPLSDRIEVARSIVAVFFGPACEGSVRGAQLRGFPRKLASAVEALILGDFELAIVRSSEAHDAASHDDNGIGGAIARLVRIVARSLCGQDVLRSDFESIVVDLQSVDVPEVVALAHLLYGGARLQGGDLDGALGCMERCIALCTEIQAFRLLAVAHLCRAWVLSSDANCAGGLRVLESASTLLDALGQARVVAWAQFCLAEAYMRARKFSEAAVTLTKLLVAQDGEQNAYVLALAHSRLAVCTAHLGDGRRADELLGRARTFGAKASGAPLELVFDIDALTIRFVGGGQVGAIEQQQRLEQDIEELGLRRHHPVAFAVEVLRSARNQSQRPELFLDKIRNTVSIGGQSFDLSRNAAARRIVYFLAARSEAATAHELFDAGWPHDSHVSVSAATNRVYNAIHWLRKTGFDRFLVHDGDGYRIAVASTCPR